VRRVFFVCDQLSLPPGQVRYQKYAKKNARRVFMGSM
jgi:hypothetical protein